MLAGALLRRRRARRTVAHRASPLGPERQARTAGLSIFSAYSRKLVGVVFRGVQG
jgi:hypothetical protein